MQSKPLRSVVSTAVILAGGLGTRLRSVVPELPKPMAPIAGRPFLEHQMHYWIEQGITRFVLSVGYRHESILQHFGNSFDGAAIEYVVEAAPLGTGGGLLQAVEFLESGRRFLLLNGDTYFEVSLAALTNFAVSRMADWCFSLFRAEETDRYMGMEVAENATILALKSGTGQARRLANGGVYIVNPSALEDICGDKVGQKISLEEDIFSLALKRGQIMVGMEYEGKFIDIGVPEDYRRAPDVLIRGGFKHEVQL